MNNRIHGDNLVTHAVDIQDGGFLHLYRDALDETQLYDLGIIETAFRSELAEDPAPGLRRRAHSAFALRNGVRTPLPHEPYHQTKDYNPHAAGKQRMFIPISDAVLASATLGELMRFHTELARHTMPELFTAAVKLGVHLVRYQPDDERLSFSSPPFPHKDQEPYVAVILCARSGNLGGGDNLILSDDYAYTRRIELQEPLETLVLTKKHAHSVETMHSLNRRPAYRDIILVTFRRLIEN